MRHWRARKKPAALWFYGAFRNRLDHGDNSALTGALSHSGMLEALLALEVQRRLPCPEDVALAAVRESVGSIAMEDLRNPVFTLRAVDQAVSVAMLKMARAKVQQL
jgi:hypothetical protein